MHRPKKIVYVSYPPSNGGAPHQEMAARYLSERGVRIYLLAWGKLDNDISRFLAEHKNIDYFHTEKNGFCSAFSFLLDLVRRVWSIRPDFLYIQGAQNTPFGLLLSFLSPFKRIYHTQDFLEPGRHKFYEFFERHFARRAERVICNEPNRARFMKSYYKLKKLPDVIRTALPKDWPRPERDEVLRERLVESAGLSSNEARLIAVGGGYSPVRCTERAFQALRLLPNSYRFVVTGMNAEGRAAANRNQVADRILSLDRLSFQKLLAVYAVCDVGLLLYANDGIGNFYQAPGRLTEYMSVGLPFIASSFPGFELLALKYSLGRVCDSESPESIAGAIQELCSCSDGERALERQRLRELAKSEFCYENQAVCLEELISGC